MFAYGTFGRNGSSLTMSVHWGIVLQNFQDAWRLIFRGSTKQATIADQCSLKPRYRNRL